MDTILSPWINQDQRNGEWCEIKCGRELEKLNAREKDGVSMTGNGDISGETSYLTSLLQRKGIGFREMQFDALFFLFSQKNGLWNDFKYKINNKFLLQRHANLSLFFAFAFKAQGQTFSFPDLFPEKDQTSTEGSMEEMQEKFMEDEKQRQKPDPRRGGVTEWFGLWDRPLTVNSARMVWRGCFIGSNVYWLTPPLWCHFYFCIKESHVWSKEECVWVRECGLVTQARTETQEERPGSIFHETGPPYRITITSNDLLFCLLPPFLLHLLLLLPL